MIVTYLLISTPPAKEYEVYNTLKGLKDVKEVHPLFGEYDLIVKLEEESIEKTKEIIVEKIKEIDGVLDLKTLSSVQF